jgi:hypothetical protein
VVLPLAEHVDRERAVTADGRERRAVEVEADKHERRLKRQRRDRVRGCPDRLAVRPDRGDHRDPGGEVAHRRAQLGRGDLRLAPVLDLARGVVYSGHDLRLSMIDGKHGKHGVQHKHPYVMVFPGGHRACGTRGALPVQLLVRPVRSAPGRMSRLAPVFASCQ